ncbi:MAG TPA: enolase C-terminal domain-like protein, partial [Caulobacteraceae bacterium]|nr:enolase C-terminal domain-like protein [Caulobacteraceae bacterium]
MRPEAPIARLTASAFRIPTDAPEADGTFAWDSTTMVLARVEGGGDFGIGFTYADACLTSLIEGPLAKAICGRDALDVAGCWGAMQREVRNLGRSGLAACAISAVDLALWDLKARLLEAPLASLLGRRRDRVPVYGSGGFTSYSDRQLREQLSGWVDRDGCRWCKMKIGTEPAKDPHRAEVAKRAIDGAALFVDANGAFSVEQALAFAE